MSGFTGEMKVKNLNKYATTKGGIKTFTATYGNDYTQGSYKNIQGTNRSSFDIEVNSLGEISSIVLNQPGFGFVVSDVFTISAGDDPVMHKAQDEVFDVNYWLPAVNHCKNIGITSALGHLVIYDTCIHSGPGMNSVS